MCLKKVSNPFIPLKRLEHKRGFMLVESLIGLFLIGSMVLLLVANQQMQIKQLRQSETALSQSREQFHQLNAVQFGASIHEGIEIYLSEGKLEDRRDGQSTVFKLQE